MVFEQFEPNLIKLLLAQMYVVSYWLRYLKKPRNFSYKNL